MITSFQPQHIQDVARAQVQAWKVAFEGILPSEVLANLVLEDFEQNWSAILKQKERHNLVWLDDNGQGQGFVSYGPPKERGAVADAEIYGLYVHPSYWRQGIGGQLMDAALAAIQTQHPSATTILWTMSSNVRSLSFYQQYGFIHRGRHRISQRYGESFEELQLERVGTPAYRL